MASAPVRSILVGTDLSPASDEVVRAAAKLAIHARAQLHIIHDFEFDPTPYGAPAAKTFQGDLDSAERALDRQIARTVEDPGIIATRRVQIYAPHKVILREAQRVHADLIVIGHGRHGLLDNILGTTADRVLRRTRVPCLIVRGPLRLPLRSVLAPVDFSDESRASLRTALVWAAQFGSKKKACRVEAMHVVPNILESAGLDGAIGGADLSAEVARAIGRRKIAVAQLLAHGDAATKIIRRTHDKVDLVVLGTHGYGAVERVLFGSVATSLARSAGCSALFVPKSYAARATRLLHPRKAEPRKARSRKRVGA